MHNIMLVTSNTGFFSRVFEVSNKKNLLAINKVTDNLATGFMVLCQVLCQIMAFIWYSQTVRDSSETAESEWFIRHT